MAYHLFHRGGHESKTVIVEADSELEARGKLQKKITAGMNPEYRGSFEDLMETESDEGFLELSRL